MKTDPTRDEQLRERVRVNVLLQLDRVHPHRLTAQHLHQGLILDQLVIDLDDLKSELEGLEELGLVQSVGDPLNGALLKFKRTEKARVALAEKGL